MHATLKLAGKRLIDHAVTLDAGLAAERLRHDMDPEMRLPARPMAGVTLVAVGFVHHVEALRREGLGQFLGDDIAGGRSSPARAQRRTAEDWD